MPVTLSEMLVNVRSAIAIAIALKSDCGRADSAPLALLHAAVRTHSGKGPVPANDANINCSCAGAFFTALQRCFCDAFSMPLSGTAQHSTALSQLVC